MSRWPYVISCAGCKVRRAFYTVMGVSNWAREHRCWENAPAVVEAASA